MGRFSAKRVWMLTVRGWDEDAGVSGIGGQGSAIGGKTVQSLHGRLNDDEFALQTRNIGLRIFQDCTQEIAGGE